MSTRAKTLVSWVLRGVAALIMLQTLFFKFTASAESVYIFSRMGVEPWGRVASGVVELIASILLLFPRTIALGALTGLGLMAGAIFAHLTILGISVQNDGGLLFAYALIVFMCCAILLYWYRRQLFTLLPFAGVKAKL